MRSHRKRRRQTRGFTLIEVLMVLAILVLLAAMVGPRILGSQKKADINTTKSQIGMFKAGLEHFALDMKTFPSTEQGLNALVEKPTEENESSSLTWDGSYLGAEEIPKDPWGRDYQYEYPSSHWKRDFPNIWSVGPDGQENTEDDIVNWSKKREDEQPEDRS